MTFLDSSKTTRFTCPECGWSGDFDARFPAWCVQHDHGLNAMTAAELDAVRGEKGRARRRREAARKRAEDLQVRLAQTSELRPGFGPRFAAGVFAALTHGTTLAVLVGSVLLILSGTLVGVPVGVLGVGIAWVVRPRIPRAAKAEEWKSRSDLPLFFGLLDRTAGAIGAPSPDLVRFGSVYNASTARTGLRHRPVLMLGIPLWQVLSGPERLALLGHELGHQVNGDATQGVLAASAEISLAQWRMLFQPQRVGARRVRMIDRLGRTVGVQTVQPTLGELLQAAAVTVFMSPIYLTVLLLQSLHAWLGVHVSLRAEFAADGLAARVGSTQGAVNLSRKLEIEPSVSAFVRRAKAARTTTRGSHGRATTEEGLQLLADVAKYIDSLPGHEYVRQARVSEFRGTSVDASHPATYLRTRLLEARPPQAAAVTVTEEEWAAIDRELLPYVAGIGVQLLR